MRKLSHVRCCPPALGHGLPGGVVRLFGCSLRVTCRAAVLGKLLGFVGRVRLSFVLNLCVPLMGAGMIRKR